jgi:NAD(P)-dependent dehydrogenase (short-subunit alcohol dehydrogenase family)
MGEQFEGKVALVTGAGSGIGAATAELLASRGARVVLVGRRTEKLEETARRIRSAQGTAAISSGDASKPDDMRAAVALAVSEFGRLDYAVNNAGIAGTRLPVAEVSVEDWNHVIDVNLSGTFYGMKYQIPAMLNTGGGAIVNVSSVFADRAHPSPEYTAAKHGVRGLTRSAAANYGPQGIRINELQPGVIASEMTDGGNSAGAKEIAERGIPLRRVGAAEEIATAVAFLLSDEASYVTASHLAVDGGFLA